MAPEQPRTGKPAPAKDSVARHRLRGVLGTGGMEPAGGWQNAGNGELVGHKESHEDPTRQVPKEHNEGV
jgi:hypothetical protein